MPTDKAGKASEKSTGLAKTLEHAVHPAMKGLGEIALARGFTQEALAKEYRERFKLSGKTNGKNVRDHFSSATPHRETIDRYAQILGVSADQLHVLEHGRLSQDGEQRWERYFIRILELHEADFKPGTLDAVIQLFRDGETRSRVLAAIALDVMALPRNESMVEWSAIPAKLKSAAAALFPILDLREFVCTGSPMLLRIYLDALEVFGSPDEAQAYVRACSAILELKGIDTVPMLDYMRKRCSTSIEADGLQSVTLRDDGSLTTRFFGDPRATRANFMPQERQAIIEISDPSARRDKGDKA